jgi:serine/threonine-protein kinase RIO1
MAHAGVVRPDLSAHNIFVREGELRFIDLSEALRVDRTGYYPWINLTETRKAKRAG